MIHQLESRRLFSVVAPPGPVPIPYPNVVDVEVVTRTGGERIPEPVITVRVAVDNPAEVRVNRSTGNATVAVLVSIPETDTGPILL